MAASALRFPVPVTLVGGGALDRPMIEAARALGPTLVAADSAADRLDALGLVPQAIVGDLDSISDADVWRARGVPVLHLAEQDTTDFEKCLYAVEAPAYVAAGFTGRRVDHMLAVFHALLRYPGKRVVLVGEEEAIALAPQGELRLALAAGARVSVYPLLPVDCGPSEGLVWPLDGLRLAPGGRIGTSNLAAAAEVVLRFDDPGALVLVERRHLGALAAAVGIG